MNIPSAQDPSHLVSHFHQCGHLRRMQFLLTCRSQGSLLFLDSIG
jgi:hypothetical protein